MRMSLETPPSSGVSPKLLSRSSFIARLTLAASDARQPHYFCPPGNSVLAGHTNTGPASTVSYRHRAATLYDRFLFGLVMAGRLTGFLCLVLGAGLGFGCA